MAANPALPILVNKHTKTVSIAGLGTKGLTGRNTGLYGSQILNGTNSLSAGNGDVIQATTMFENAAYFRRFCYPIFFIHLDLPGHLFNSFVHLSQNPSGKQWDLVKVKLKYQLGRLKAATWGRGNGLLHEYVS